MSDVFDSAMVGAALHRSWLGVTDRERAVLELIRRQPALTGRLLTLASSSPAGSLDAPVVAWQVQIMGSFRLMGPCGPVRLAGKPADLVKLVALGSGPTMAERVVEQLWPDVDPDIGRRRLRMVLHRVPHDPTPVVLRIGEALQLGPAVEVDVTRFEDLARGALAALHSGAPDAAQLGDAALSAYGGDLLGEDIYNDWAATARERLRRRRLALLDDLASHAEQCGDLRRASRLLEDALDIDPLEEARFLRLAESYQNTGRTAAVLTVAQRCAAVLADLGLPPSPAWRSLCRAAVG